MSLIVAFIIVGIIGSGYMVIKTGREEREAENEWIEQEGEKYITRMNEEKLKRLNHASEEIS
ncbi:MAG: sporulation YhaL family protein [Bacillus sp. (in: firmicutes)]